MIGGLCIFGGGEVRLRLNGEVERAWGLGLFFTTCWLLAGHGGTHVNDIGTLNP